MNSAHYNHRKKSDDTNNTKETAENDMVPFKLDMFDIFYYGLNYVGVLTGDIQKDMGQNVRL